MSRPDDLRAAATLLGQLTRSHWLSLAGLAAISALAALTTAAQPLMLAPALDATFVANSQAATRLGDLTLNNIGATLISLLGLGPEGGPMRVVAIACALYFLTVCASSALSFGALQLTRILRTEIASSLQRRLFDRLLGLSMPFFVANRAGDLSNRFVHDVIQTAGGFDPIVKALFEALPQIALYGFLLVRTDLSLAVVVVSVALLHLVITQVLKTQIRRRTADSFDAYARIGALVQETFSGIRIVKSFSAERYEHSRLEGLLSGLRRIVVRFGYFVNSEQPLREIANALAVITALLVASSTVAKGGLSTAGLVLFVAVTRQAVIPFAQLNTAFVQFQATLGSSQRIREILAAQPGVVDGTDTVAALESGIRLDHVTFAYETGKPVLKEVSLDIPRGAMVALVGPSGSGKSTLADLVLRLADPTAGRVLWNGRDIRGFRQSDYRRHFGVVSQEALLFNTTIEENIAYGRPVDANEVRRAAQLGNALEFIDRLTDGFATVVGERGVRLSGGQRQRIAIARAVYGRPDVLVLDEATSALDSESERLVQEGIDRSVADTTTLVIAHRLSTVRKAHRIVVLDHGRVEAVGAHEDLLQSSALYRKLHDLQFGA